MRRALESMSPPSGTRAPEPRRRAGIMPTSAAAWRHFRRRRLQHRGQSLRRIRNPWSRQRGALPIYRPSLDRGTRPILLQGAFLFAHARPLHADRSDRIWRRGQFGTIMPEPIPSTAPIRAGCAIPCSIRIASIDPGTAGEAPNLPLTETDQATDTVVVTALKSRVQQAKAKGVSSNDELPIIVITGQKVKELVKGTDYTIKELICNAGADVKGDNRDHCRGACNGRQGRRAPASPEPSRDRESPPAVPRQRNVVQYIGWQRGKNFGAGKLSSDRAPLRHGARQGQAAELRPSARTWPV